MAQRSSRKSFFNLANANNGETMFTNSDKEVPWLLLLMKSNGNTAIVCGQFREPPEEYVVSGSERYKLYSINKKDNQADYVEIKND